jgi:hypothetical protein
MLQEHSVRTHSRGYIGVVTACAVALAGILTAAPAAAQECAGEVVTVCGFVWDDDGNGTQDLGEAGIEGVKVTLSDGTDTIDAYTDSTGFYQFDAPPGTYTLSVSLSDPALGANAQASPTDAADDSIDSDGVSDGTSSSVTVVVEGAVDKHDIDFGFHTPQSQSLGTGTPGYWKNHPEAWPASVTVGGLVYDRDTAIYWLGKVGKDKTTTMFSSLVPAILNRLIGNPSGCVDDTIAAADAWMATHGPVGSGVPARSEAWAEGEPLHAVLDDYNNGRLCAPHRN